LKNAKNYFIEAKMYNRISDTTPKSVSTSTWLCMLPMYIAPMGLVDR